MRILELINSLDVGGAERVVTNLSFELRARGHSVHVICLRELGHTPVPKECFEKRGVMLRAFGKGDGFSRCALRALTDYLRDERIDVVHTHNPPVNHYGVVAAYRAGVRAVVNTVHGTATLRMSAFASTLFRASCLLTSRVVSVCGTVGDVCGSRLPLWGGRGTVIHNGIELEPFVDIRRQAPKGIFRFGTAGRLVPVKDHHTMLCAFARAHRLRSGVELHILGEGELDEELRQLARKLGISDSVVFHGFSRDVAGFMSGLDCFLMSSLSEGLPMAALEAMASGLPMVSTAVGGMPELIGDSRCGWLCQPGDAEALAQIMMQATDAEDLCERGTRARQAAVAKYSVRAMAQNYERLFEELLSCN